MSELGSKTEVKDREKDLEDQTQDELDKAGENVDEAQSAREALESGADPGLTDTVEALNRVADCVDDQIGAETAKHQAETGDRIEAETTELSEPVREAEESERTAADEIEGKTDGAGRYRDGVHEYAEVRVEAAEFLGEVGDESEQHQELSREEIERLSDQARAAAEAIRRF